MTENHTHLFSADGFMPHGMCYLWRPDVLLLHVTSDALITLAYFSIPFTLMYFVRKRKDLEFSWVFVCFAIFIVACGSTHLMEIWVIWHPTYWLSGTVKAITAMASVPTAILLVKLVPDALRLPSAAALRKANAELNSEILQRQRAENEIRQLNKELESRVMQRTLELEATNHSLLEEVRERQRVEQGLRESESSLRKSQELLQAIIDNSTAVIYVKDVAGRFLLVNRRFEELFHVSQDWLIGKTDYDVFPKESADAFCAVDQQVLTTATPLQIEEVAPHDDGPHTYISTKCQLRDADGQSYAICGISTDITERKHSTEQLRERTAALTASLAERDVLLQEIHHRVKNNLQIISSLINMQARKLGIGAQQDQLKDCKTRVDAIALIHEQLYQSSDYARIPFSDYVKSLVNNILHAADSSVDRIAVQMQIEQVALSVDKAIPCGLILNELMTNALKHAFPDGRRGTIRVELRLVENGAARLVVSDDGIGMPEREAVAMHASIGMVLITTLTEQMEGHLTISRQNGTSLCVEFPTHR